MKNEWEEKKLFKLTPKTSEVIKEERRSVSCNRARNRLQAVIIFIFKTFEARIFDDYYSPVDFFVNKLHSQKCFCVSRPLCASTLYLWCHFSKVWPPSVIQHSQDRPKPMLSVWLNTASIRTHAPEEVLLVNVSVWVESVKSLPIDCCQTLTNRNTHISHSCCQFAKWLMWQAKN